MNKDNKIDILLEAVEKEIEQVRKIMGNPCYDYEYENAVENHRILNRLRNIILNPDIP